MSETSFRLTEHLAIELINSDYTYNQLKFFMNLLPALTFKNNLQFLDQRELQLLAEFVKIISGLIDSKELSLLMDKFCSQPILKITSKKKSVIQKVDFKKRSEILSNEMLNWVNALPYAKRRKMGSVPSMEEFFTSEFFFKEFIKWMQQINLTTSSTLVEILDAYYRWFPIMPRQRL
ncbi:hypothetical protein SAMN05443550_1023 [Pedobacter hartonius]|uniref:Uncharacterized protein n=2 Tax=Pedobacter hartonius TaxID=425514 RepID=A0A1H3YFS9_9SPHI|nr:hypothetical protein SAMN05443550_1023 [Pedobacter hartonius]